MSIILDGTSGITTPTTDSTAEHVTSVTGFKNRIINGGMVIDQRNAGASVTPTSGLFTYITDRFAGYPGTSSSVTYSRSTNAPTGFSYSFKAQRPVSNTNTATSYISQVIESNNMRDLVGQSATISFWVLAGANYSSGQVAVYLNTGTVADQGIATSIGGWTGYATAVALLFTPTTTWTKYTATGTIPSNALEMAILFGYATTGTAGADDSLYITGVQLEKGSVATSFDYRPYGTELSLCQRYYEIGEQRSRIDPFPTATIASAFFAATKRATPTITGTATLGTLSVSGTNGVNGAWFTFTSGASGNFANSWTASAEL